MKAIRLPLVTKPFFKQLHVYMHEFSIKNPDLDPGLATEYWKHYCNAYWGKKAFPIENNVYEVSTK